MTIQDDAKNLAKIFLPYFSKERDLLEQHDIHLAHYTNCEVADKIIRNQEIWLRDSTRMNDSREVSHGIELIDGYFGDNAKAEKFKMVVDATSPGATDKALGMFQEWKEKRRSVYLISLSRHAPPDSKYREHEAKHGRLSMWRGYGGPQGVAIIFKIPFGQASNRNLMLFLSPAGYFDSIDEQLETIITNVIAERKFLSSIPSEMLVNVIFLMMVMAAISLKHPGFAEEDEWRLLYLPETWKSDLIVMKQENIRGKNEIVCKLPFAAFEQVGIRGMDTNTCIENVIVGPGKFAKEIKSYIADALRSRDIKDADKRVILSGTPFREKLD